MTVLLALQQAAKATAVPFELLRAICTVESNLNPAAVNQYDGGSPSYGLCQIKQATAELVGYEGEPEDLLNPHTNALYAAKYLKRQILRYNHDWIKAISAYNNGKACNYNVKYVNKVLDKLFERDTDGRIRHQIQKYSKSDRTHSCPLPKEKRPGKSRGDCGGHPKGHHKRERSL